MPISDVDLRIKAQRFRVEVSATANNIEREKLALMNAEKEVKRLRENIPLLEESLARQRMELAEAEAAIDKKE